jgi:methylated-DNA-protein-cysteine methyltransferase-like protein
MKVQTYSMEKTQPSYYDLVYAVVRQVPRGRVTNYGAIADFLALGASRMVGWALNQCHGMHDVPAHRVVNRKGELSGRHHFATSTLMQELLEHEGVRVENDCVVEFNNLFWHPRELGDDWEAF